MMPEQVLSPEKKPEEKPFPWRCPKCRQPTVNRVTMPYRCQRTHNGRVVTVEIADLVVPRCSNCGELVFDYAADERIRSVLRNQFGPAETAMSEGQKHRLERAGALEEQTRWWKKVNSWARSMAEGSRELRRKLGAVLVKLKKQDFGFTQEEWQLAKVLEARGLAKYLGPDQSPKMMSIEEYSRHVQLCAVSHYVLTGNGEEFVRTYTEEQLLAGGFLLPGETPWYDRWPWKLVWPAVVSVITALVTTLIVQAIKGSGGPFPKSGRDAGLRVD